jgi:hypothetical protein
MDPVTPDGDKRTSMNATKQIILRVGAVKRITNGKETHAFFFSKAENNRLSFSRSPLINDSKEKSCMIL